MCENYLLLYHRMAIIDILKEPDKTKHFPLNINFVELSGNDTNLGNNFLRDPEKCIDEWNQAVKTVQTNLISDSDDGYTFKNHIHCRIHSLPLYPELHRTKFPQNDDTNKFLQVSGTVVRMTAVKMLEYQRQYICAKCKYIMIVTADYDFKNIIVPPKKCGNPEECKGTNIVTLGDLNSEFCKDYQEIKLQETVNKLDVGSIPASMWVTLDDDLVDSCKPGDNVTICGLVKRRQNQFFIGKKIEIELVMKTNHIHVNNNNTSALSITPELKHMFQAYWKTYSDSSLIARDIIVKSICPELFGIYIVKLAVAVVLAGGSTLHNNFNTGVRVRAEPHLLLVGDPGTGKSQLLRFASKVIPRSVLTTGVGSTAAGLTVTAVMENGEWQLEAGALVMSDGGICCIDEFNTMKEHDRTSIHEAMEQQTISVAKASIVCKLSTRCSILAATNPKGNLDPSQPLNMNVALASPLLSRFDLILLLRDKVDQEWDSQLVDYIFNSFENCNITNKVTESIHWNIEILQAYFAVIKKIHPMLTEDSNKILSSYYQAQRRNSFRNKSRTTVRLLDSLVRLSQGHARLMYHEKVEIVDAIMAVVLVETGMETDCSVLNLSFNLRNDFPLDPMKNYQQLAEIVLKKLDLSDLLEKELLKKNPSDKPSPPKVENNSPVIKTESKFFNFKNNQTANRGENKSTALDANGNNQAASTSNVEKKSTSSEDTESKNEKQKNIFSQKVDMKRSKSKNDISPKKIKLQNKTEVRSDLAALNCMPSIHDVFKIDDFDNEENTDSTDDNIIHKENLNEKENNSDEKIEKIITNKTSSNNLVGKDAEEKSEILTQRTRTKAFFSKFKFVPKDNEPESTNKTNKDNIFESEDGNISFTNVESSAPSEKVPAQSKSSSEDQSNKKVSESITKKFNFKKITKINETETTNVTRSNMFESEHIDISFTNAISSTQVEKAPAQNNKFGEEQTNKTESESKKNNLTKPGHSDSKLRFGSSQSSIFETEENIDDLDLNI